MSAATGCIMNHDSGLGIAHVFVKILAHLKITLKSILPAQNNPLVVLWKEYSKAQTNTGLPYSNIRSALTKLVE